MILTHRYIARIILEAQTPLFVGSGASSLMTDALVQKDVFGFPMIQGTSLAGVLRHTLEQKSGEENWNTFFGYADKNDGRGSRIKISSAYLILENGKIAMPNNSTIHRNHVQHFSTLPVRQHVRIDDKGVAAEGGLFENEVVYKGCRFVFEIELSGDGSDEEKSKWKELLSEIQNPFFRLGQGTRNGYGNLSVHQLQSKTFNLEDDFDTYLNFHPSFNEDFNNWDSTIHPNKSTDDIHEKYELTHYQLKLSPDDFFLFNSGFGDEEVDNTPVREGVISYQKDTLQAPILQSVIPASSIKGAISHRTCYHYNRLTEQWADKDLGDLGIDNEAVYQLFGAEAGADKRDGHRGKIILDNQFFIEANDQLNILNHVAIDRFTGGALEGALFSEKVSQMKQEEQLKLDIYIENTTLNDERIKKAIESALTDICCGLLPLGGMTTKGHGVFTGTLFKNNEEIYSYE